MTAPRKTLRSLARAASAALLFAGVANLRAAPPSGSRAGEGTTFDTLSVGSMIYQDVRVRSVNSATVVITHSEGLASIPLRQLSPELQKRFGYDPNRPRETQSRPEQVDLSARMRVNQPAAPSAPAPTPPSPAFAQLLRSFNQPPEVRGEVDMRPRFRELDLGVKNQGRRPSCAIFAVVSALEFQNAEVAGRTEKFSEEYLIWATRKTTGRNGNAVPVAAESPADEADEMSDRSILDVGFALPEVANALRAYGIPLQSDLPNKPGVKIEDIPDPSEDTIALARQRRRFDVGLIPGATPEAQITGLLHALNAGLPVVVGLKWPHERAVRSGFLDTQQPQRDYAHAIALVGYRCDTGLADDAVFAFKNSYGPTWGMGGYGQVTGRYLKRALLGGLVFDVRQGETTDAKP